MSGTATLERKGGAGPAVSVPGMEHKAAAVADIAPQSGVLAVEESTGIVRAIVSVTGIVDNVDDRILPGAYTKTLKDRNPKGVWSHDWKDWVSRTLHVEEYLPGDPRLPKETKDGKPWPKEAGALVVETQFNMKSARCREAFEAVSFFSETGECEWSIGYVVPPGQASKDTKGVRNIKSLDLFEYGPVLFGAASESMTLSVKSAQGGGVRVDAEEYAKTIAGLGGSDIGTTDALPDGSFRIQQKGDLRAALSAYGRASDRVEAKTHIVGRALALKATEMLPKGWLEQCQTKGLLDAPEEDLSAEVEEDLPDEDELLSEEEEALALAEADAEPEAKMDTSPVGTPGGKENWVDKVGGLPKYIRAIAHALIRAGKSESTAIATAVATVKRWAAGGGKVSAKTQAKAAKAVAEWEAKKAASHATKTYIVDAYDPTVEVKSAEVEDKAMEVPMADTKMWGSPHLPGTHEAVRQALRDGLTALLRGEVVSSNDGYDRHEWDDVDIVGTYADRVIVTRVNWKETPTVTESFEVDYEIDEDTGLASLGEPRKVRLSVQTVVEEDTSITPVDGFNSLPDHVEHVASGVKALMATRDIETKSGKVLSGANEARLTAAAEHLFAVLRAAGIAVNVPGAEKPVSDPTPVTDTTAPAAATQAAATQAAATGGTPASAKSLTVEGKTLEPGMVILDPRDYVRGLNAASLD